jgi:hypothetical protein
VVIQPLIVPSDDPTEHAHPAKTEADVVAHLRTLTVIVVACSLSLMSTS